MPADREASKEPYGDEETASLFREASRHLDETVRLLADETREVDGGWLARTMSLPLVHTLNQLHLDRPISPSEVIARADDLQRDLAFRYVLVNDAASGRAAEEELTGSGWRVEREVLMVLSPPAADPPEPSGVSELREDEMLALMRRWLEEEFPQASREELDQVDEYNRREGLLWNERRLGRRGPDGEAVAVTKLRRQDTTAWVEDVYTLPHARRQGHARALVTTAVREALQGGSTFTFIIADDNDWPKHLYEAIGFRPVGLRWLVERGASR